MKVPGNVFSDLVSQLCFSLTFMFFRRMESEGNSIIITLY